MEIKVKYTINKELDIQMAKVFGSSKNPAEIEEFYDKNLQLLKTKVIDFKKAWEMIENDFVASVEKIFPNFKIKINCVGFISIFDFNPRFLNNNTFQVYYNHKNGSVFVTMHEILHFIFYTYTKEKHSNLFKNMDTETGPYWDLSELINSVILTDPLFGKLHGIKNPVFYPEHEKYLTRFEKIWSDHHSIDRLITEGIKIVS